MLEIINLVPATDNITVTMLCSVDGGANFDATVGNYQWARNFFGTDNAVGGGGGTGVFFYQDSLSNTTVRGGIIATIDLLNLSNATHHKKLMARTAMAHRVGVTYDYGGNVLGIYKVTTVVNALRIIASSGNWASGSVRLYGMGS
jgi:hypothetical protein